MLSLHCFRYLLRHQNQCEQFLRMWRQDLHNKFGSDASKYFITTNAYEGCEINLISILSLAIDSKAENINLLSSQQCEHYFRMLRSFTTMESTVVNFSMKDLMIRLGRIDFIEDLVFRHKDSFKFPRKTLNEPLSQKESMSEVDIESAINSGIEQAEHEASYLGVNVTTIFLNLFIKPSRISLTEPIDEEAEEQGENVEEADILNVNEDESIVSWIEEENIVNYIYYRNLEKFNFVKRRIRLYNDYCSANV